MAKEIIWTPQAANDRWSILEYFIKRNKSNTYSIKLDNEFREAIEQISRDPRSGLPTDRDARKYLMGKGNYYIIYRETLTSINILRIWDNRQDPERLKY